MNIKSYYKSCGGSVLGTEQEKISHIQSLEKTGNWIAESKKDGIWLVLIGSYDKSRGYSRRGLERIHGLPHIGEGNIIIGELSESTEEAIERKKEIGHNFLDVHDIIQFNGKSLINKTLTERKLCLKLWYKNLTQEEKNYYFINPVYFNNFAKLYQSEKEGIILKRKDGLYNSFDYDWLKVKKEDTWDFVIIGYQLSDAESKTDVPTAKNFLIAQYIKDVLTPMGKVPIPEKLGIEVAHDFSKFKGLVVEVRGFSRTKKGCVRSPRFERLRTDKPTKDCIL